MARDEQQPRKSGGLRGFFQSVGNAFGVGSASGGEGDASSNSEFHHERPMSVSVEKSGVREANPQGKRYMPNRSLFMNNINSGSGAVNQRTSKNIPTLKHAPIAKPQGNEEYSSTTAPSLLAATNEGTVQQQGNAQVQEQAPATGGGLNGLLGMSGFAQQGGQPQQQGNDNVWAMQQAQDNANLNSYLSQAYQGMNTQQPSSVQAPMAPETNAPETPSNPLVAKLQEENAKQESTYTPDKENKGRGVANFLRNAFKRPETEEERRAQIQNIAAFGDVARNLANLYYTNKKAYPQNIQNQTAVNDAKWQAEDATNAAKQQKANELALKQLKEMKNEEYKERQLAQGDVRNRIALANYGLNEEKHGWDKEDRPYEQATKKANSERATSEAGIAKINLESLPEEKKAKLQQIAQSIRTAKAAEARSYQAIKESKSRISIANQRVKLAKMIAHGSGGKGGKNVISNVAGTYSRKNGMTELQRTNILSGFKALGFISEDEFRNMNKKGKADIFDSSGKSHTMTADELFIRVMETPDETGEIRNVMEANGFTYTPSKMNPGGWR